MFFVTISFAGPFELLPRSAPTSFIAFQLAPLDILNEKVLKEPKGDLLNASDNGSLEIALLDKNQLRKKYGEKGNIGMILKTTNRRIKSFQCIHPSLPISTLPNCIVDLNGLSSKFLTKDLLGL